MPCTRHGAGGVRCGRRAVAGGAHRAARRLRMGPVPLHERRDRLGARRARDRRGLRRLRSCSRAAPGGRRRHRPRAQRRPSARGGNRVRERHGSQPDRCVGCVLGDRSVPSRRGLGKPSRAHLGVRLEAARPHRVLAHGALRRGRRAFGRLRPVHRVRALRRSLGHHGVLGAVTAYRRSRSPSAGSCSCGREWCSTSAFSSPR